MDWNEELLNLFKGVLACPEQTIVICFTKKI